MERGRERIDAVLPLAVEHGSAVVALAIDEVGMAHTADRKVEICKRIFDIATGEFGLEPGAMIFDVLTFPVTTGQEDLARSALETLEGIRRVKTSCRRVHRAGVTTYRSARPLRQAVLNSVFLHHAVQAGLDLPSSTPPQHALRRGTPEERGWPTTSSTRADALPSTSRTSEEQAVCRAQTRRKTPPRA